MRAGRRVLGVVVLAGGLLWPGSTAYATPDAPAAPVSLVVGLHPGADTDAPVERLEARTDVDAGRVEPLADDSALTVDVPSDRVAEAAAALRGDPAVSYVEIDRVARVAAIANDPAYAQQWGLKLGGVVRGWNTTRGTRRVVIAVVDTGVRAVPDLAGRLLPGYDFVNDDHNATDDEGHGTMTAGVLGANANNRSGVAGICWYCRILPVKVLDNNGLGYYSDIADGIRYAANHGADIINLSLGGSDDSVVLRDAVNYATGKGALVIAAAGNDGSAARHYPAAIGNVLAVGASTARDGRYSWSNYGASWVDIAAPGCNPAQTTAGRVALFCGTSSATPFVSGVAALLASTTPAPTVAQIRTALTSSAAGLTGNWVARSSGRVDAARALQALPFWYTGVTAGATVGRTVTVRPHVAARSGIDAVHVQLNGVTVARDRTAPWSLRVNTSGVRGPATLTVIARAGSKLRSRSVQRITVDRTAPAASMRYPSVGSVVRGTVAVGVHASDAARVGKVELVVRGRVVATDRTAPYALRWNSAAGAGGTVTLTARAYDRVGNVGTAARSVRVDN